MKKSPLGKLIREEILRSELKKLIGKCVSEVMSESRPGAKSFCITGTMAKVRSAVQDDIRDAGHIVFDTVKPGLDYLVAEDPESGSNKMKRAEKFGVKVISEKELYKILKK